MKQKKIQWLLSIEIYIYFLTVHPNGEWKKPKKKTNQIKWNHIAIADPYDVSRCCTHVLSTLNEQQLQKATFETIHSLHNISFLFYRLISSIFVKSIAHLAFFALMNILYKNLFFVFQNRK